MRLLFKVLIPFVLILLASCEKQAPSTHPASVVVSIPPYAYIVKKIAGDTVQVQTAVPAGSNPHVFEPKPSDLSVLQNVKVFVCIGETFEKKIVRILEKKNSDLILVDLSGDASISHTHHCSHHHDHTSKDLHFWLSPKIVQKQSEGIAASLIQAFPEHKALYLQNLGQLQAELEKAHLDVQSLLSDMKGHSILASHAAFAYFCKEYNLEQFAIEFDGKDPLPKQITSIIETAKKRSIRTIISEPQHSSKGAAAIAKELNIPIVELDPYHEDYIANLLNIAKVIAQESP